MNLTFPFSDLPLLTLNDLLIGMVEGEADVSFDDEGQWSVKAIRVQAHNPKTGKWELVEIDGRAEPSSIYFFAIYHALTDGSFKPAVDDAVAVALAEEGAAGRSDFEEHNTLSAAYQG